MMPITTISSTSVMALRLRPEFESPFISYMVRPSCTCRYSIVLRGDGPRRLPERMNNQAKSTLRYPENTAGEIGLIVGAGLPRTVARGRVPDSTRTED